ncbi:MAG TPA: holo-[acyl-carrier-protein] synthase [Firmicutes bacterium]|nr:holo-[acyl-carrier-protein] synthase [Bacillota bacterium]
MIVGIGIDIVNIKRFRKKIDENPSLLKRVLTQKEIEIFKEFHDPVPHYAGRFALKEAIIKAAKERLNIKGFKDIEILKESDGSPILVKPTNCKLHISLSHEDDFVVAVAVLEE